MNSSNTLQNEIATLLHFDILRKRSRLRGERQFNSTLDRRAPSLPSSCTRYEGRVRSQRMTSPSKKWETRNQSIGFNQSTPVSNLLWRQSLVIMTDVLWQTHFNDKYIALIGLPNSESSTTIFFLSLSFLHLMKRRKWYMTTHQNNNGGIQKFFKGDGRVYFHPKDPTYL